MQIMRQSITVDQMNCVNIRDSLDKYHNFTSTLTSSHSNTQGSFFLLIVIKPQVKYTINRF